MGGVGGFEFGSGQSGLLGQMDCGSKWIILSGLKTGSSCGLGPVRLTRIFHMNFYFYFYKENNMYLPFEKFCNKLLDVKCITLNSPLISRMNSVKLINTY